MLRKTVFGTRTKMVNRNEVILLYNLDNQRGKNIKLLSMRMGIRIKSVTKDKYLEPIGLLAGIKEVESNGLIYEENGFQEEMVILKGFTDYRLDEFLRAMRRNDIDTVALKAIITDHNQEWNSLVLYEEIKKENERLRPDLNGSEEQK